MMQKVYLLLRNNLQAGPFTLEEIIAQGIKKTDLIWVEGKSASWRYPSEVEELRNYLAGASSNKDSQPGHTQQPDQKNESPKTEISKGAKKVFVSLPFQARNQAIEVTTSPADALEQKAEALRQKLQAYQPQKVQDPEPETNYSRSLKDMESDYTLWKQKQEQKKNKRFDKQQIIPLLVIAVVIAVPLYFLLKPSSSIPAVSQVSSSAINPLGDTIVEMANENEPETENKVLPKQVAKQIEINGLKKVQPNTTQPVVDITEDKQEIAAVPTAEEMDGNEIGDEVSEENDAENAVPPTAKKKTIGEAIDGFFGKFKSKKEEETSDRTASKPDAKGERKSSKRAETASAPPPDPEQLVQQVKVTANEPAENWMLGIKGLKLTLHNQSAYKLSKAAVEVAYFDEQNTLLEKKTVMFQNVPAKKTVTIGAPDHRLASYAKHQLITVSSE